MARKAFLATDAMREQVRSLATRGVPQEKIAAIIDCDAKTLRKHFRNELDRGMAEADAEIVGALFANAKKGNVAAQIFWVKTRMHWREREAPRDPIPGTDAESAAQVVILLPDNNRDPELTEELRKAQSKYLSRKRRRSPSEVFDQVKEVQRHLRNKSILQYLLRENII